MRRLRFGFALLALVCGGLGSAQALGAPVDQSRWASAKKQVRLPNGIRLAYVETGKPDGPPLLLLHGFTDSSRIWTVLLPYFSEYRVLIPDQRGHGASDAPACCYSPSVFAEDARLFLDALRVKRAAVVGHSLGSMVGQVLAAEHPERVSKLVLAGSTAMTSVRRGDWIWQRMTDPARPPYRDPEFMKLWSISSSPTPVDAELVRYWDNEASALKPHIWRAIPRELLELPIGRYAPDINAPVLILSGGADPLFTPEHHRSLVKAFPSAQAGVFAGLGHNFIVERPTEVGPVVQAFLQGAGNWSPAQTRGSSVSRCAVDEAQKKWGPASLPAPTAPSEGSAGVRDQVPPKRFLILDPGSPAQASLPIVVIQVPKDSSCRRCSAALLGMIALASRFARSAPKSVSGRVALEEDHLFRRLFPAGPGSSPKALSNCLPAEIGPLVTCRTRLPFPAFGEAGTAVPIT
jgi:pimeloyl-ACP methyl ester carboxylesterase